jgi:hypothetical protein
VNGRGYLLLLAGLAGGLPAGCGSVDVGGLAEGAGASGPADAGAGGDGGSPALPPGDGSSAPLAQGLVLRQATFVEGFEGSDWQCSGTLCLRGRITP